MKVFSGKEVRKHIFDEISSNISSFDTSPRLLAVVIGNDPACVSYAKAKGRKAEALGARFNCLSMDGTVSQADAEQKIRETIREFNPDGIIIEKPLPKHIDFDTLTNLIPPDADVDCQRMDSLGKLLSGNPTYIPATAGAVLEILKHYDVSIAGSETVIVGRSMTVGMPLSILLLGKGEFANATVTVCHSRTKSLKRHTKRADILIVAAGKPGLINGDMVSDGSIVIDVGTNYVDGELVGDVDFATVSQKAAAITPVPGGVGPVTTAYLLKNLVNAYKARRKHKFRREYSYENEF